MWTASAEFKFCGKLDRQLRTVNEDLASNILVRIRRFRD